MKYSKSYLLLVSHAQQRIGQIYSFISQILTLLCRIITHCQMCSGAPKLPNIRTFIGKQFSLGNAKYSHTHRKTVRTLQCQIFALIGQQSELGNAKYSHSHRKKLALSRFSLHCLFCVYFLLALPIPGPPLK